MAILQMAGHIEDIGQGGGGYTLEFRPIHTETTMVLVIPAQRYYLLFPAGDPDLASLYQIEVEDQGHDTQTVLSVFNLQADVIPVDAVGDYAKLEDLDKNGEQIMDLQKMKEEREALIKQVQTDPSLQAEVDEMLNEASDATAKRIESYKALPGLETYLNQAVDAEEDTYSDKEGAAEVEAVPTGIQLGEARQAGED